MVASFGVYWINPIPTVGNRLPRRDGISASVIAENWYGKQNPRVPTADGVREPQNRRVEVTM
jgi:outer membrane protein OmpA-like peptidoglycan-associated protein